VFRIGKEFPLRGIAEFEKELESGFTLDWVRVSKRTHNLQS
jgi:hypothetical protein